MPRYALVKNGITENIMTLEEGVNYTPPEGIELVAEEEAPMYRAPYAEYLLTAETLADPLDEPTVIDYISLEPASEEEAYRIMKTSGIHTQIRRRDYALQSSNGVIVFSRTGPGAYLWCMAVLPEARGQDEEKQLVLAGVKWMFLNTDAKIICGLMDAGIPAIIEASKAVPGAKITSNENDPAVVYCIGDWIAAYGVEKALLEMAELGQAEKADRLKSSWSKRETEV